MHQTIATDAITKVGGIEIEGRDVRHHKSDRGHAQLERIDRLGLEIQRGDEHTGAEGRVGIGAHEIRGTRMVRHRIPLLVKDIQ